MLDIITIGDSVVDIIVQVPRFPSSNEETVSSKGMHYQLGGSSNFLIMSSRLGRSVGVIDQVGDDNLGSYYKSNLASEGVDVSHLVTVHGEQTAHCICLVNKVGNHAYISFPGATYNLSSSKIVSKVIESAKVLYISGYSLTSETIRKSTLKALEIASTHKLGVYFDLSPQVANIPPSSLKQVISQSTGIFLNEREYEILKSLQVNVHEMEGFMVLKQGARGCTVYSQGKTQDYAADSVVVVDTTGAGDVFNSAFIFGDMERWDLPTCALFANALAAEKVKKLGAGLNVPTREQSMVLKSRILSD